MKINEHQLHVVGPYNCPARRNRACLMNEEECHMLVGVECIFFDHELREKIRQLRLQNDNDPKVAAEYIKAYKEVEK